MIKILFDVVNGQYKKWFLIYFVTQKDRVGSLSISNLQKTQIRQVFGPIGKSDTLVLLNTTE